MIFIRNRNGSHNPQEAMEIGDFEIATAILAAWQLIASGRQFALPASSAATISAACYCWQRPG
ncbi:MULTISPECIES: hypothetical protein [Neorhizobium]|uniref:hypothetical protein n=1 Tax=Neorhizobium TaxID=1525371 RepID=UPI00197C27DD|nr:hypothetical protein [Neorhizobium sp. T25_13]